MFDLGWSELVLIGVVALIVIGPKELPAVLRMIGQWTAKIRRMASEFQGQFNEALREAEMADLKKQVEDINETARSITHFNPLAEPESKSAPVADAGESALVDASSSRAPLPAVNDVEGPTAAEPLPGDTGGAEPPAETVGREATTAEAPANAGALSTEPRPAP
ncbi:MAG: Sec-independent protein translocase protein TatB [Xanthobacteraceae bacterium]